MVVPTESMHKKWAAEDFVQAALDRVMPSFVWQRMSERERTRIVKELAREVLQFCTAVQKSEDE